MSRTDIENTYATKFFSIKDNLNILLTTNARSLKHKHKYTEIWLRGYVQCMTFILLLLIILLIPLDKCAIN